jgi:hypothetical protein
MSSDTFCTSYIEITSHITLQHVFQTMQPNTDLRSNDSERVGKGWRMFYDKFHTAMEQILRQYNGKILPHSKYYGRVGCYFPKTSNSTDENAFIDVLECCLKQLERQQSLSIEMTHEKLPNISYKIGADYRPLNWTLADEINRRVSSGPAYEIWRNTPTNAAALGHDLYKVVGTFPRVQEKYVIERISLITFVQDTSIYSLSRK